MSSFWVSLALSIHAFHLCSNGDLDNRLRARLSRSDDASALSPEELLNLGCPQHQRAEHDADDPLHSSQVGRREDLVHEVWRGDEEHRQQ